MNKNNWRSIILIIFSSISLAVSTNFVQTGSILFTKETGDCCI